MPMGPLDIPSAATNQSITLARACPRSLLCHFQTLRREVPLMTPPPWQHPSNAIAHLGSMPATCQTRLLDPTRAPVGQ